MSLQNIGQIGTEYLIIISFVTFVVLSVLGIALLYSSQIQDTIKFNQVDRFATKVTSSAESVFYSGDPARITITAYLPQGITQIRVQNKELIFNISTSNGPSVISYPSKVNLAGTISPSSGVRKLLIIANNTRVDISQAP